MHKQTATRFNVGMGVLISTRIETPKYYSPYYRDPQKVPLILDLVSCTSDFLSCCLEPGSCKKGLEAAAGLDELLSSEGEADAAPATSS